MFGLQAVRLVQSALHIFKFNGLSNFYAGRLNRPTFLELDFLPGIQIALVNLATGFWLYQEFRKQYRLAEHFKTGLIGPVFEMSALPFKIWITKSSEMVCRDLRSNFKLIFSHVFLSKKITSFSRMNSAYLPRFWMFRVRYSGANVTNYRFFP